jgi:alpha-glucosidase
MENSALWWQSGIVYQIYPRSFQDSDGDGIGDLNGIGRRLDYFTWLGIDSIWISPFYPSPMADFGYDVTDYTGVHPMFGTLDDLDRLVTEAHGRGLKVILDWVPNHTSEEHPWFIESRSSRDSPKRDWYMWRDPAPDGGPPNNWVGVFGGSAWEYDEATGQYYYHAFLKEQPDLNWRNPEVRDAMHETVRFWLDRGIDGLRVDAYWFLFEDPELRDNPVNPHGNPAWPYTMLIPEYTEDLPEMRLAARALREVFDEYDDRVIIGEMYLPIDKLVAYYGSEGEPAHHLPFNFGLITEPWDARTIAAYIDRYENAVPVFGWPNWVLGNHDRHRIATRIGPEQARVAALLLLTLRGTPTIYQGEELGMENVPVPPNRIQDPFGFSSPEFGRDPARTPMQWDASLNAGFTIGEPWLPLEACATTRNVETERRDPHSMLMLYKDLIDLRRREPALTLGRYLAVETSGDVVAYARDWDQRQFLIVLNFGPKPVTFALPDEMTTGQISIGTNRGRDGQRVTGHIDLDGNDGVVIAVSPMR